MKWMGGWSAEDWYSAPLHLTNEIIKCVTEEQEQLAEWRDKIS